MPPETPEALAQEVTRLREKNRALHRRCQEAEAALPDWHAVREAARTNAHRNLGKALMTWGLARADEENAALRVALAEAVRAPKGTVPDAALPFLRFIQDYEPAAR